MNRALNKDHDMWRDSLRKRLRGLTRLTGLGGSSLLMVVTALAAPPPRGFPDAVMPMTPPSGITTENAISLFAEVLEAEGRVHRASLGTSAAAEGWTPVSVGDRLDQGTLIRTGLGSRLVLRFGESHYVSIERATLACISQFYRTDNVERINIGLGYGAVRGASAMGTLRTELTVSSPVATLAKEGTRDWEIRVEAHTGRFTISLATEGLINAIQNVRSGVTRGRLVRPGEYATQDNIAQMWLRQAQFDRSFTLYDVHGLSDADVGFLVANTSGISPLAPGSGAETRAIAFRDARSAAARPLRPPVITAANNRRPEGNFGIAQPGSSE